MNNKLGGTTPCTLQTATVLAAQHAARLRGHQEMLKKDANFLWLETGPLSSPTASSCLLLLASPPRLSSPASLPLTRAAPKTRDTHAFRGASAVTPGTPHTPHTIGIGSYCLFVRKRIRCSGISPQIPLSPPTPYSDTLTPTPPQAIAVAYVGAGHARRRQLYAAPAVRVVSLACVCLSTLWLRVCLCLAVLVPCGCVLEEQRRRERREGDEGESDGEGDTREWEG